MADIRTKRMESLLQEQIGLLILRDEIKDPRVDTMVSISAVSVSKDLVYATVRVSGFKDPPALEAAAAGLNDAAGFVQRRLGKSLHVRNTPRLTFVADHSIEQSFEVNRTLGEISQG